MDKGKSKVLDDMLDGGLYATELTEIAGAMAVGKTQICLCAASCVAASTEQHVLYMDTCASFSGERLEDIISATSHQDVDIEASLSRIRCEKIFDIYELLTTLDKLRHDLSSQTDEFYSKLKLLIVDSLPAVVSPVLGGQQSEGLSLLAQVGLTLKSLAADFTLAVLVTNNTLSSEDRSKVMMGKQWQHVPHTRVLLEKNGYHVARLVKSSRSATTNKRVQFTITDDGIAAVT